MNGASRPLVDVHVHCKGHDQLISKLSSSFKVPFMPDMEDVKAAIGEDDYFPTRC